MDDAVVTFSHSDSWTLMILLNVNPESHNPRVSQPQLSGRDAALPRNGSFAVA